MIDPNEVDDLDVLINELDECDDQAACAAEEDRRNGDGPWCPEDYDPQFGE